MKRTKATWFGWGLVLGFLLFIAASESEADPAVGVWIESQAVCVDPGQAPIQLVAIPVYLKETYSGGISDWHLTFEFDADVWVSGLQFVGVDEDYAYGGITENWSPPEGNIPFGPQCGYNGFSAGGVYTALASPQSPVNTPDWTLLGTLYGGIEIPEWPETRTPFATNIKLMCGTPSGYPIPVEVCVTGTGGGCKGWGDGLEIFNACIIFLNDTCSTYPWPECTAQTYDYYGDCPHQYCLTPPKAMPAERSTWTATKSLWR